MSPMNRALLLALAFVLFALAAAILVVAGVVKQ